MDRFTGLSVFVRVAEGQSFSGAARRLNMSTTMVSNHVQALEDRLGVRLLHRTTRKVNLTDAGRAYYERCVRILGELDEADEAASLLHSTVRGTLRLHAGNSIMPFISPVVLEFLARHAEASVDVSTGERAIDLVEEGFDLAIRPTQPADSSIIVRRLAQWHHILCCAPSYLEKHATPRRLEDLAQHNCLRYAFYPFGDEWHFMGPGEAQVSVRVSGNLVTNTAHLLRAAAISGHGILLAPTFLASEDLKAGRLVPLLADHRAIEFSINASYPTRHHLSTKVRVFLDLAVEHFVRHRQDFDPGRAS